ncbi:hypothetical protein WICPIJ_007729 [Wickerhamomyces pijperi]|uniref:RNA helicase n=1 Tax=Wickerhamomyces pijperi TaxID=599730 RepID=A0A9P8Q1V5_WICPI|nr:hypothetical protein WICPIJ_007729 [Wickerhamomyces pijperi]
MKSYFHISWRRLIQRQKTAFRPFHISTSTSTSSSTSFSHQAVSSSLPNCTSPVTLDKQLQLPKSLRPYQQDCITTILTRLQTSNGSTANKLAISLPTGSGKTVLFTHLIPLIPEPNVKARKTLILVHRKELALQAFNMIQRELNGRQTTVGIDMAESKIHPDDYDVIIGSVQSLTRGERLNKYDPEKFKCIIIDEAHHAAANSYLNILRHFGVQLNSADTVTDSATDLVVLGFSATFQRHDNKNLDGIFQEVVYHLPVEQLIDDGYLSDVKFSNVKLKDADLSLVKSSSSKSSSSSDTDFVIHQLSKAMNNDSNNEIVFRTYQAFVSNFGISSTIFFCVDIEHTESLAQLFKSQGIKAEAITSKTPNLVRSNLLSQFHSGQLPILMNCGILTEGTDLPRTDSIFLCRPTRSTNLLIQMIGRGLRRHQGKEWCQVVDFIGVNGKSVVSVPMLRGLNDQELVIEGLSLSEMDQLKKEMEAEQLKRIEDQKAKKISELDELLKLDPDKQTETSPLPDIELTTYQNYKDFINNELPPNTPRLYHDEMYQLMSESKLVWLMGPTKNEWVLSLPSGSSGKRSSFRFLKLEIHPVGALKRSTFDSVMNASNLYQIGTGTAADAVTDSGTDNALSEIINKVSPNHRLYSLKLYESNPLYRKGFNSVERYTDEKRFQIKLLCKIQHSLPRTLQLVSKFLSESKIGEYHTSKFIKWRSMSPSDPQLNALYRIVEKCYSGGSSASTVAKFKRIITTHKDSNQKKGQLSNLGRGKVSDLLFLWKVFKTSAVKRRIENILKWDKAELQN